MEKNVRGQTTLLARLLLVLLVLGIPREQTVSSGVLELLNMHMACMKHVSLSPVGE